MNGCAYQQKNAFAAVGEMRGPYNISVSESVVCPKPRRIGILNPSINDYTRPSRFQFSRQTEISDLKAGTELLDMILTEGNCGAGKPSSIQVASSPPFFSESPPSRASNPLIEDSQFCNKKLGPLSPKSPSSSARQGGAFTRMKFGQKPVAVRIEGFDCLSSDRRNCGISAVA